MNDEYKPGFTKSRGGFVIVEFKGNRREIFKNPSEFPFKSGDLAIVEADRGQDAGMVRHVLPEYRITNGERPEYIVIRRATIQDTQRINRLRDYEEQTLEICRKKVRNHKLPMKLVDAECRFDGLKLIFYFTADGRVDFRELVRDLAGTFRTRIELCQIGARDETKRWDGFGTCGRQFCCVSFMNSFQPVTTQIAKAQNLILNPAKLSGRCGRLKCCMAFEYEYYINGPVKSVNTALGQECDGSEDIEKMSD